MSRPTELNFRSPKEITPSFYSIKVKKHIIFFIRILLSKPILELLYLTKVMNIRQSKLTSLRNYRLILLVNDFLNIKTGRNVPQHSLAQATTMI